MIRSFKCADTQALFAGQTVLRFVNIRSVAERKLEMVHRAGRIDDLRVPPNNRLEKLKGDRKNQWGIRISDQWCICFEWRDGHAFELEITDCH